MDAFFGAGITWSKKRTLQQVLSSREDELMIGSDYLEKRREAPSSSSSSGLLFGARVLAATLLALWLLAAQFFGGWIFGGWVLAACLIGPGLVGGHGFAAGGILKANK